MSLTPVDMPAQSSKVAPTESVPKMRTSRPSPITSENITGIYNYIDMLILIFLRVV